MTAQGSGRHLEHGGLRLRWPDVGGMSVVRRDQARASPTSPSRWSRSLKDGPVSIGFLSPGIVDTDLLVDDYDGQPEAVGEGRRRSSTSSATRSRPSPRVLAEGVLAKGKNGARVAWLTDAEGRRSLLRRVRAAQEAATSSTTSPSSERGRDDGPAARSTRSRSRSSTSSPSCWPVVGCLLLARLSAGPLPAVRVPVLAGVVLIGSAAGRKALVEDLVLTTLDTDVTWMEQMLFPFLATGFMLLLVVAVVGDRRAPHPVVAVRRSWSVLGFAGTIAQREVDRPARRGGRCGPHDLGRRHPVVGARACGRPGGPVRRRHGLLDRPGLPRRPPRSSRR